MTGQPNIVIATFLRGLPPMVRDAVCLGVRVYFDPDFFPTEDDNYLADVCALLEMPEGSRLARTTIMIAGLLDYEFSATITNNASIFSPIFEKTGNAELARMAAGEALRVKFHSAAADRWHELRATDASPRALRDFSNRMLMAGMRLPPLEQP